MAFPTGRAQFGKHFRRVVAALRRDDDVAALKRFDVKSILQNSFVFRLCRGFAACVRGGKENRLDQVEVALYLHAVDQDRTDHAAPADQSCEIACEFHGDALKKYEKSAF